MEEPTQELHLGLRGHGAQMPRIADCLGIRRVRRILQDMNATAIAATTRIAPIRNATW